MLKPLEKYSGSWKGIDAGREGLWREPLWSGVLEIINNHQGEDVYDPASTIYMDLTTIFPKEKWCSLTTEGGFRPLFRDYPHPWTRPGLVDLAHQLFRLTPKGRLFISGEVTKKEIFIEMLSNHMEDGCKPFAILAFAFLESPKPITAEAIFWGIVKNYRPTADNLLKALTVGKEMSCTAPPSTQFRRLKHMLQLMRSIDAIESYRSGGAVRWAKRDTECLVAIINFRGANDE
jgi:hypothetical protein